MTFLIIIGVIVVLGIYTVMAYNRMIKLKNQVKESGSQIDVQLKYRADLIPNLVNTVKGYSNHESQTLTNIARLRSGITQGLANGDRNEAIKASDQLTKEVGAFQLQVEAYPDLKASSEFTNLMGTLQHTEEMIASARRLYNSTVASLNTNVESFPTSIIASIFHFKDFDLLTITEEDKKVPDVKF